MRKTEAFLGAVLWIALTALLPMVALAPTL